MNIKKFRSYFNSFWLTFFLVMIINQLLLFVIFHLVSVRPTAKDLTQIFGASLEMARYFDEQDPLHGLDNLRSHLKNYPAIEIEKKIVEPEKIPWSLFGIRMLKNAVLQNYAGVLDVGYMKKPNGSNTLVFQNTQEPIISLRVSFGTTTIAEQYLQYALVLVLIISVWAAYWISSRIVRPLESLSASAIRLGGSNGSSSIDLNQFSVPEIRKLANTLNEMQEKIDSNIREREALLSGVTHDIRTPLSRMRIALELNNHAECEFKDELLEDINEMNTIIQQFNELAKLNVEIAEPWQMININELIREIQLKYSRAKVELTLNLCPDLRYLKLKPLSITRLLYNLIDNAYRHGNSDVTISTYQNHREVMISVSNPVSADIQEHDTYQDPIFNHKTGLGLKIINRLVDVHNATITQSTVYGVREYRLVFLG